MNIVDAFVNFWRAIVHFAIYLVGGLEQVLVETVNLTTLSEIELSMRLFSDNPIVELDLFTILVYFVIVMFSIIIYKIIKKIILLPFKFWGLR